MRILTLLRDEDLPASALPRAWNGVSITPCKNANEVIQSAERGDMRCAILDVCLAVGLMRDPRAHAALSSLPVILRMSISPIEVREIVVAAEWLSRARVSLRGFDDIWCDLAQVLESDVEPTPEMKLIHLLPECQTVPVRSIAIASVLLGRRRTGLPALSRACGVASRTIEWRLKRWRCGTAGELLGWSVALHALWRLDMLEWPLKRAAADADFADASTLSAYIKRHTGYRPAEICRRGGFEFLRLEWQRLADKRLASSLR
jgi:hypothetical protein